MVDIIKNNLKQISNLCRQHHVESLYLFGSAQRVNDFTDTSDIDLLVNFKSLPLNTKEEVFYKVENQEQLHENLESLVKRKIDLVREENIKNKFLKYFINKEKKLLYGIS